MENKISLDVFDEDCSAIFETGLELLLKENIQFISIMENNFILESFDIKAIFEKINIKKILIYIWKKFISIIETLWNKFKAFYSKFTSKNALIKKYKKELSSLNESISYEGNIDIFDHLSNYDVIGKFSIRLNITFRELEDFITSIQGYNDREFISEKIVNKYNELKDSSEFNNSYLRGEVLTSTNPISSEDYNNKLVQFFKPQTGIQKINYSPDAVKNMVDEYLNNKTIEKNIIKEKDSLKKETNKFINKINSFDLNIISGQLNPDIARYLTNILQHYIDKMNILNNSYSEYFNVKLAMFVEYKIQEAKILTSIIRNLMKEDKI